MTGWEWVLWAAVMIVGLGTLTVWFSERHFSDAVLVPTIVVGLLATFVLAGGLLWSVS